MAKRNHKLAKRKKIEPAVTNLSFTANGNGVNYIDLSLAASIANRRFYRQGLNWAVSGFTVTVTGTTTAPGSVTICKVPTTWVSENAWKKAFAMWNEMNDQVLDDEETIRSKYHDFKVYMTEAMTTSTLQTAALAPAGGETLLPVDCDYNLAEHGEWEYSEFQIPNDPLAVPTPGVTEAYLMHLLGASGPTSKGLISGYAQSRSRPQEDSPNVPLTSDRDFYNALFNVGETHTEIRAELVNDNDQPPYKVGAGNSAFEYYPGGEFNLQGPEVVGYGVFSTGGTNAITAQRTIRGGQFPCGLIEINSNLPGITYVNIIVHLVPGSHRGYLANSMLE